VSFPTPHDGSGTILRFGAAAYTVTNIVISNTNPAAGADSTINVAHLGQSSGELAATLSTPLVVPADDGGSGRQITFDYIGRSILLDGSTATVYIAIGGTALIGAVGAGGTAFFATVASSTLTLATNDAVRGQGVLTLVRTGSLT
jgi:hypothetical protein